MGGWGGGSSNFGQQSNPHPNKVSARCGRQSRGAHMSFCPPFDRIVLLPSLRLSSPAHLRACASVGAGQGGQVGRQQQQQQQLIAAENTASTAPDGFAYLRRCTRMEEERRERKRRKEEERSGSMKMYVKSDWSWFWAASSFCSKWTEQKEYFRLSSHTVSFRHNYFLPSQPCPPPLFSSSLPGRPFLFFFSVCLCFVRSQL